MKISNELTPSKIVSLLDQYVVGQDDAKKDVAISLRTRWRRSQLDEDIQKEVIPANMILIGSTGVGKTEIARRIANLTNAPFIKSEVTKFTEVGYVGGQVDTLITDLAELAATKIKEVLRQEHADEISRRVSEEILDYIAPTATGKSKERIVKMIHDGDFDQYTVEYQEELLDLPPLPLGLSDAKMKGAFDSLKSAMVSTSSRTATVKMLKDLIAEDIVSEELMDPPTLNKRIVELTENQGIIFLDEIDKIIEPKEGRSGLVSREGVQRDLLPLVEGTTVTTKFGPVNTDHILFIAAGAFHKTTPSDLMPEFQGRFPIRVELKDLTTEDFVSILTKTRNSLITQQIELLKTEGIVLSFTKDAITCMAEYATTLNTKQANLGARRLHTIVTALLKEVSFNSPDVIKNKKVRVDKVFVEKVLKDIVKDDDLSKYIL